MKYKRGELALCKQDFVDMFKKDYWYKITKVAHDYGYNITDGRGRTTIFLFKYPILLFEESDHLFGDYFYTKEELRKVKLEKIKKSTTNL